MVVIYVSHGLVGQFSRGEYGTGIFLSAAVDPVGSERLRRFPVKRKHDQTLRLELDHNPRGTFFESALYVRSSREWVGKRDGIVGLVRA